MAPVVMERQGNCGGLVPGGLPILYGPPVNRCPVAMGAQPDVRQWAQLVPGPSSDGLLAGVPDRELPPFYRQLRSLAVMWKTGWAVANA